ncbi:Uncharacterised protein [Klebsiella oxytoca]|nr:Uncharacterised protein [Klebsiella oxytoca]
MKNVPNKVIQNADLREKHAFRYHRWILKGTWLAVVLFFIWQLYLAHS